MQQPMTTCPNCGLPIYGKRIREFAGYLEIKCPRCGIQEKDMPGQEPIESPRIIPIDEIGAPACPHDLPRSCCAICAAERKASEAAPWDTRKLQGEDNA